MTIAISIKVNDGIVLAADSASTMIGVDEHSKPTVINIYDNANKIFNLRKGLSIGAITWGTGSIGHASISTLAKDFREAITNEKTEDSIDFDKDKFTIEEVAIKFKDFIFDKYEKGFKNLSNNDKPDLGFMIVGYSAGRPLAEEYRIDIAKGECNGPTLVRSEDLTGITWNGLIDAISRLYKGHSALLRSVLTKSGLKDDMSDRIINLCNSELQVQMVTPAMPIQDAIDLAIFLVDATANFSKFAPGATTVGGPIEVATITKYEGFRWIKRKHYFEDALNPIKEGEIK